VATTLVRKAGITIDSPTGKVPGEMPMWAEVGEKGTVDCTKEVFPGFVVCGMAANAVGGAHRMGPIFGGMLNSGKKAAELIQDGLR
jgi:thiamine thiazole synthase